jgi:uncharacterized membrane protein YbhN (UPF0104 family)
MNLLRATAGAVLIVLLYGQFAAVDLSHVTGLLAGLGASSVLVFLPFSAVLLLDAAGWKACISTSINLPLHELFIIRLSTDAIMNTLPAGVALAETLRPLLLQRRFGLALPVAVASTVMAKVNMAIMQMLFILVALLLLTGEQGSTATHSVLWQGEGQGTLAAATLLMLAFLLLPYAGFRLTWVIGIVRRVPMQFVRRLADRYHNAIMETDNHIAAFVRGSRFRLPQTLGLFLLSWLAMAFETWLLFYLLGTPLSLAQAIALEGLLSAIKLLFFFIPSGLGAQEIGIPAILGTFGLPEIASLSAAFILLRRGKELGWALTGLGFFGYLGVNPFRPLLEKP